MRYGSVQGSALGPKFSNIYVRSQPEVFLKSGFETFSIADDSNGSKKLSVIFQHDILKNYSCEGNKRRGGNKRGGWNFGKMFLVKIKKM